MKKIFTLIAVATMALSANAQKIAFSETDEAAAGTLDGNVFEAENFKITITDTDGKFAVDKNAQWFGTAEAQEKSAGGRLKSGGKSSSKNNITATIPAAGTLKIWARSGSGSATDRTVVLSQNGSELYNNVVKDADAVKVKGLDEADPEKETNVFPVITVSVAEGTVDITYPVGSMNFYGFEFVAATNGITSVKANTQNAGTFNLAGQKVAEGYKGIAIQNGKKVVLK